jgi:hypothetical protein
LLWEMQICNISNRRPETWKWLLKLSKSANTFRLAIAPEHALQGRWLASLPSRLQAPERP